VERIQKALIPSGSEISEIATTGKSPPRNLTNGVGAEKEEHRIDEDVKKVFSCGLANGNATSNSTSDTVWKQQEQVVPEVEHLNDLIVADGKTVSPEKAGEEQCSAPSVPEEIDIDQDGEWAIVDVTDCQPTEIRPYRNGNGIALLAVDLQNDFLGEDPSFLGLKLGSPIAPRRKALLKRIDALAGEVRRMGGVVVFCKSQYGAWSAPQKGGRMKEKLPGAHMRKVDCCSVGSAGADFHPDVEMMIVNQDIVVIKEWYSCFMGTALNRHLERLGVGHVVVTGVTTNHSIKATVTSAANLGYNVILASDGTAQFDDTLQKKTEQKLAPLCTLLNKGRPLESLDVSPDPCMGSAMPEPGDNERIEIDGSFRISGFGAGDCIIVPNFLAGPHADVLLSSFSEDDLDLGLAAAACQIERNSMGHIPVYRSNHLQPWESGFESTEFSEVSRDVKTLVEKQTGHNLNFGQTLCFKDGSESMDWHSDKNLDLRKGSFVAVLSLGSERALELKPKKGDGALASHKITLAHNSLLLLGPETTRHFVNSTPPDEQSTSPHIQFNFMDVATFFAKEESNDVPALYGQGTPYGTVGDLQKAEATRRLAEQFAMGIAASYTMTLVRPGRGGSMTFTMISAAVATAATAMWFRQERQKAWSKQQEKIEQLFLECDTQPLSVDEALHKILTPK